MPAWPSTDRVCGSTPAHVTYSDGGAGTRRARSADLRGRPSAADQRRSCPDLDVLRMSFALMLAEPVLRGHAKRYVLLFGSGLSGDVTVAVRGAKEAAGHCQPLWPSSSSLPA